MTRTQMARHVERHRGGRAGWMVLAGLAAWVIGTVLAGCTDEGAARHALRGAGYTDVVIGGWDAWTCAKGDSTCTEFTAKGPSGVAVHGAVGCGSYFGGCASKGCTVRLK